MKSQIAASRTWSKLGALAGLVLSPLIVPATASVTQGPGGTQQSPDAVWSNAVTELTEMGRAAARDIRRAKTAGIARIAELDAQGADLQEISQVGFRTVQYVMFRSGEAQTEIMAHMHESLDFLEQFGGPADLREQIARAARAALNEVDGAVDEAVDEVHQAIWLTLQKG